MWQNVPQAAKPVNTNHAKSRAGWGWLCATGQKVAHVKSEHFGQLGKVLWTRVAAASLPGLDVPIVDPECVADLLL